MAYEEVTSPILTDATGQEIVDKLDAIAQAVQPPTNIEASDVTYDNTQSGMTATDAQAAIDENAADITGIKSNLTQLVTAFGTITKDTITSYTGGSGVININIPKNSFMLAVVPNPDSEKCVTPRGFNPNYSTTEIRYTYNVYTIYNSGSHYLLDKVFNTSVTFDYYYLTIPTS